MLASLGEIFCNDILASETVILTQGGIQVEMGADSTHFSAVEEFLQCASRCTGIDVLLQYMLDILKKHDLARQVMIVLANGSEPDSRLWVGHGLEQPVLKDLLEKTSSFMNSNSGNVFSFPGALDKVFIHTEGEQGIRIGLFAVFPGESSGEKPFWERSLRVLVSILGMAVTRMQPRAEEFERLQYIVQIKQQWEATVDNLPELICLLDEQGRVVRTNRTLERWGLGSVLTVRGKSIHEVLHPGCNDPGCVLQDQWNEIWRASDRSRFEICEFFDHHGQRDLRLSVRRSDCDKRSPDEFEYYSVLIAEDVSEQKWEEHLVTDYSEELYRQLQMQASELVSMSGDLNGERLHQKRMKKILKKSEEMRKTLSARLLTAQEEERKRIAAELHDGIGQSISAAKFRLEQVLMRMGQTEAPPAIEELQNTVDHLHHTVEDLRRMSMGLRPSMLDDLGLLPTLRWLCREYQASFAHIKLDTDFDIDETTLSKDQINMIFRIVQEGMNNASKHAFANRLMVRLIAKAGETTLEIEDDGLGFDLKSEKIGEGFGLSSMRERAMLTGGSMTIDSMPGKGTRLRVAWKKTNEL